MQCDPYTRSEGCRRCPDPLLKVAREVRLVGVAERDGDALQRVTAGERAAGGGDPQAIAVLSGTQTKPMFECAREVRGMDTRVRRELGDAWRLHEVLVQSRAGALQPGRRARFFAAHARQSAPERQQAVI